MTIAPIAGIHSTRIEREFLAYSARISAAPVDAEKPIDCHPALERDFGLRDRAKPFLYNQISSFSLAPPVAALRRLLPESFWPVNEVARMTVPTLFVAGERDDIFSPDLIREAASRMRGAEVREIPLAGHSAYFETPDEWNKVVHDFIKAHC